MRSEKGFTLVELMIVVIILATIAAFAIPNLGESSARNQLSSTANEVTNLMKYARAEAMRSGKPVTIGALATGVIGDDSGSATASWNNGAMVYLNQDGSANGEFSSATDVELRRFEVIRPTITVDVQAGGAGVDLIEFDGTGFIADQATITVCDSQNNQVGHTVTVLSSGVPALNRGGC
jgi:prepilin-type N-terminal cleavage/methylation domain-containing protein